LGLGLKSTPSLQESLPKSINSSRDLFNAMLAIYYHAEEILNKENSDDEGRIIWIHTKGVGLLDLNPTPEMKQSLLDAGDKAADFFLHLPSKQPDTRSTPKEQKEGT
jgi:hypothetical protein